MSRVTNWNQGGIWPLQDHDEDHTVGRRMMVAGARVRKFTDVADASSGEDAELVLASENGYPTVGDVHPWLFWQSAHGTTTPANPRLQGRDDRPMGMWAQSFMGVVAKSRSGTGSGPAVTALPILDGTFTADTRFEELGIIVPSCFGQPPKGSLVLIYPGVREDRQGALAVPIDKRLYAPHTFGPGDAGTNVSDFQPEGRTVEERTARLQSLVRVISLVPGSIGRANAEFNALALNFATTEQEGSPGLGLAYGMLDSGGGTTSGGGTGGGGGGGEPGEEEVPAVCKSSGKYRAKSRGGHGVASLDRQVSGPFHCGDENDKHRVGDDADGHPINAGHLSTNAYFFRSRRDDGPLLFEGDWPGAQRFPLRSFVHLTWDGSLEHPFVKGARSGMWRWWAEVPFIAPDRPTTPDRPPPPPGPRTPGPSTPTPSGPATPNPRRPTTGRNPGGGQPQNPGTGGPGRGGPITGEPTGPRNPPPRVTTPAPVGRPTTGPRGSGGQPTGGTTGGAGGGTTGPRGGGVGPQIFEGGPQPRQQPFPPGGDPVPGGGLDGGAPQSGFGTMDGIRGDAVVRVGDPIEFPEIGEYELFHPLAEGFAGISFRPQLNIEGLPSYLRNPEAPAEDLEDDEWLRPTVVKLHSWGAHAPEFERWDYAVSPEDARTRGGIVDGGLLFAPPAFDIEDYLNGGVAHGADSRHIVMFAPGVELAWGEPVADRTVVSPRSVLARRDMMQDVRPLVVSQVDDAGTDVPLVSLGVTPTGEPQAAFLGTSGTVLPRGDDASRMSSPAAGTIRVSSEDPGGDVVEFFDGGTSAWVSLGVGGGGETNTLASPTVNASLVLPKTGSQLNMRGLVSTNDRLTVAEDGDDVSLALVEANIVLANLSGVATVAQYPSAVLLDGSRAMTAELNAGGFVLSNVADPVATSDAATRQYVDGEISGLALGEDNTLASPTSNTSLVLAKTGSQLNVRGLVSMNPRLVVTLDGTGEDVQLTVDETAIILANLSGAATDAQYPNAVLRDGTRAMTAELQMATNRIEQLGDPVEAQDAATKAWVEANFVAV